jgi:hypothetical protein
MLSKHKGGETQSYQSRALKRERKMIRGRLRTILDTFRSYAIKHLEDWDMRRREWRIDWTIRELEKLAQELVEEGLPRLQGSCGTRPTT